MVSTLSQLRPVHPVLFFLLNNSSSIQLAYKCYELSDFFKKKSYCPRILYTSNNSHSLVYIEKENFFTENIRYA
jgi:hypothetical protein